MIYFDTSVAVALYLPEAKSAVAADVFHAHRGKAIVSDLVQLEFACALSARTRAGDIETTDAVRLMHLFDGHIAEGMFQLCALSGKHLGQARTMIDACRTPLGALDAIHLALASALAATLVTSDVRLVRAAQSLAVPVKHV